MVPTLVENSKFLKYLYPMMISHMMMVSNNGFLIININKLIINCICEEDQDTLLKQSGNINYYSKQ